MSRLGLLGGTPVRTKTFPFYEICEEERRAVMEIIGVFFVLSRLLWPGFLRRSPGPCVRKGIGPVDTRMVSGCTAGISLGAKRLQPDLRYASETKDECLEAQAQGLILDLAKIAA